MVRTENKRITPNNALEPDKASGMFITSLDRWIERVTSFNLSDPVPEEVSTLFETAQGSAVYGFYFYPLLSLGGEHLHRALECAVSHRCGALGGPTKGYAKQLDWLRDRGILTCERHAKWRPLRDLRNEAAHPKFQPLYPPPMFVALLADITKEINALFETAPGDTSCDAPSVLT